AAPIARIFRLLRLPQEEAMQTDFERRVDRGHLSLSNICLKHPGAGQDALKDISLEIAPGEKVGLIGRSGSGKSTLLQLFIRMHDADEGHFLIDGHNAGQFAPQTLRQVFTYMSQENELFDGSIFDNLLLAASDTWEEDIEAALIASGAHDFVRRSPAGLSQGVGKRGAALSGGERQAICLTRALLPKSKLLLLDEPTSSMDQTMEGQVLKGLKQLSSDQTLILATHRVNILAAVDRIVWMDSGKILADGPRDQILARLQKRPINSAA
ncbi:MAG: ATP-binding cassette domain-containing protein, partial [Pseudomonadota bacterium]